MSLYIIVIIQIKQIGWDSNLQTIGNGYGLDAQIYSTPIKGSIIIKESPLGENIRDFYIRQKSPKHLHTLIEAYFGTIELSQEINATIWIEDIETRMTIGKLRYDPTHYNKKYITQKCRDLLWQCLCQYHRDYQIQQNEMKGQIRLEKSQKRRTNSKDTSPYHFLNKLEKEKIYCKDMVSTIDQELKQLNSSEFSQKQNLKEEFAKWTNLYDRILTQIQKIELDLSQEKNNLKYLKDNLYVHTTTDPFIQSYYSN